MAKLEKKETIQAVLIADNFNDSFKPFSSFNSPVGRKFAIKFCGFQFISSHLRLCCHW